MTSRLTSDDFMPSWPIAMPSVTVIVVNSRGVPPAAATPFFTACAWRDSAMLHGAASFQVVATPTSGWSDLLVGQPHRIEKGAVRRALRADRHMPARQPRFVDSGMANVVGHLSDLHRRGCQGRTVAMCRAGSNPWTAW